jgi:hypothetical protein
LQKIAKIFIFGAKPHRLLGRRGKKDRGRPEILSGQPLFFEKNDAKNPPLQQAARSGPVYL